MSVHDYTPMAGPLPGVQFIPSNGTQGESFVEGVCGNCERDKIANGMVDIDVAGDDDMCPILGASYRGEAVEWREMPDGTCKCLGFVPMGERVPERDTATFDMFAGQEGGAA